jgi:hypothetical protein
MGLKLADLRQDYGALAFTTRSTQEHLKIIKMQRDVNIEGMSNY